MTRAKAARAKAPAIDPKARELLQRMSEYLGSLDRFTVHTEVTQEVIFPSGLAVDSDRATDLKIERPDHLRADILSGMRNVQVFYDGKNVTLYTPKQNLYGEWPAPPTIDQLITAAEQRGLSFPASDFLFRTPYQVLIAGVQRGSYVGKALVRGVMADHLAFRQKGLDWQLWIQEGDKPLPIRLAIADRAVKGNPRYSITMTDWDTSPTLAAAMFTFTPPEGAKKIAVLDLSQLRARRIASK